MMTLVGDIYYFSLNHLIAFQNVSFYIQASDILSNIAVTKIFNETITVSGGYTVGATLYFLLFEDNSSKHFYFNMTHYSTAYLWLNLEQSLNVNLTSSSYFLFEEVYTEEYDSLFKITKLGTVGIFGLSLYGNTSLTSNYIYWNIMVPIAEESLRYTRIDLDESTRHFLLSVTLSDPSSGYISMIMYDYYLIATAYVFDINWDYVGRVGPATALQVSAGTYHIWVVQDLRDGTLWFRYDDEPHTDTDPYYAAGFETIPLILGLTLIFGFLAIKRKFKKSKRKKLQ